MDTTKCEVQYGNGHCFVHAFHQLIRHYHVKKESFYDILIKFGVPKELVRLIKTCLRRTQSKMRIGNYWSSSFLIENGLEQGDASLPLSFNFALEYTIRKIQEINLGLDTNCTHQL